MIIVSVSILIMEHTITVIMSPMEDYVFAFLITFQRPPFPYVLPSLRSHPVRFRHAVRGVLPSSAALRSAQQHHRDPTGRQEVCG